VPYIVFALICGPLVIWSSAAFSGTITGAWKAVAISSCALGFAILWLSRFQIVLADDSISYRTLFGGRRVLRLSEIERAQSNFGPHSYWDRFGLEPLDRLVVEPYSITGKAALIINRRVFSNSDIKRVLHFLGPKFVTRPTAQTGFRRKL
jgi:hypothetical protein